MTLIRKTDLWLDTPVRDEVLMMHGETGKFMSLNASASVVWAALVNPCNRDQLVTALTDAFDIDEATARSDLEECLAVLDKEGAIAIEEG